MLLVMYRENRKVSQSALADHVGISQSGMSRIESGKGLLTIERLACACDLLDLYPGSLLGDADSCVADFRGQGMQVSEFQLEPLDALAKGGFCEVSKLSLRAMIEQVVWPAKAKP
jgi:transcriptional regulator with XRE-family HTH domain